MSVLERGEGQRNLPALAAPFFALLFPLAFSPNVNAFFWTPKYVLLGMLAAIGLPCLVLTFANAQLRPTAIAALGFLAVACISTLAADKRALATFGLYGWGDGLLFWAAMVGGWALGATAGDVARRRACLALVAAAVISACVALLQTVVDLGEYHLGLFPEGRAPAFLGNPVHLSAFLVGALGLVAHRWWNRVALLAGLSFVLSAGLQVAASRFAIGVAVVVAISVVWRGWRPAAVFAIALVLGLLAGNAVAHLGGQASGTSRVAEAGASGSSTRLENWWIARHAVEDHPILGAGPGQYRAATSQYRTITLTQGEGADRLFYDGHNSFVTVTVTMGVLGAGAYLAWLALALRRARGPFLAFALGVLALHLVEPHSVGTTPLLFFALGAAAPGAPGDLRAPWRAATWAGLVLSSALGAVLLTGDFRFDQARLDFKLADARAADRLLPSWPEPAERLSRITLYESIRGAGDPHLLQRAVAYRELAVSRDPTAPNWWYELGELYLITPAPGRAEHAFQQALRFDPQSVRARAGLAELRYREGRYDESLALLDASFRRASRPGELEALNQLRDKVRAAMGTR